MAETAQKYTVDNYFKDPGFINGLIKYIPCVVKAYFCEQNGFMERSEKKRFSKGPITYDITLRLVDEDGNEVSLSEEGGRKKSGLDDLVYYEFMISSDVPLGAGNNQIVEKQKKEYIKKLKTNLISEDYEEEQMDDTKVHKKKSGITIPIFSISLRYGKSFFGDQDLVAIRPKSMDFGEFFKQETYEKIKRDVIEHLEKYVEANDKVYPGFDDFVSMYVKGNRF